MGRRQRAGAPAGRGEARRTAPQRINVARAQARVKNLRPRGQSHRVPTHYARFSLYTVTLSPLSFRCKYSYDDKTIKVSLLEAHCLILSHTLLFYNHSDCVSICVIFFLNK